MQNPLLQYDPKPTDDVIAHALGPAYSRLEDLRHRIESAGGSYELAWRGPGLGWIVVFLEPNELTLCTVAISDPPVLEVLIGYRPAIFDLLLLDEGLSAAGRSACERADRSHVLGGPADLVFLPIYMKSAEDVGVVLELILKLRHFRSDLPLSPSRRQLTSTEKRKARLLDFKLMDALQSLGKTFKATKLDKDDGDA